MTLGARGARMPGMSEAEPCVLGGHNPRVVIVLEWQTAQHRMGCWLNLAISFELLDEAYGTRYSSKQAKVGLIDLSLWSPSSAECSSSSTATQTHSKQIHWAMTGANSETVLSFDRVRQHLPGNSTAFVGERVENLGRLRPLLHHYFFLQ